MLALNCLNRLTSYGSFKRLVLGLLYIMAVFKAGEKKNKNKNATAKLIFCSANTYLAFLHLEKLENIYF